MGAGSDAGPHFFCAKQGFVLLPKRSHIDMVALRFLNPGELGIPTGSIVMADDVIATLSPHIRQADK